MGSIFYDSVQDNEKIKLRIMSIIITGATGFIGRELVKQELSNNNTIIALTRDIEKARIILGANKNLNIINLEDYISGKTIVNCDRLIHLAWSNVQNYTSDDNLKENLEFQINLMQRFVELGIKDVTAIGTCFEYGKTEGVCKEDIKTKTQLPTTYAQAKTKVLEKLQELEKEFAIKTKWVRIFYVYGVGSRPNSLLSLLLKAIEEKATEFNMSKGDQLRDFINITTLVNNIIAISKQDKVYGIINNGNGKPVSVLEFAEEILRIKNYKMKLDTGYYPYSEYEPHTFWADITKLKAVEGIKFDDKIWL